MPTNIRSMQWYENDPSFLEVEKKDMNISFPDFRLVQHPDGHLYWQGIIEVGILTNIKWELMAVYSSNYPNTECGERVRVYLMGPTRLMNELEWKPKYLCQDGNGMKYISITQALGTELSTAGIASAVSYLSLAIKWLIGFELVLNGDLSKEEFNSCNAI